MNFKNILSGLLFITNVSLLTSCILPDDKSENVIIVKESDIVRKSIGVNGMTCVGCEVTLEDNISKINGVVSVKASHTDKEAIIEFDSTKTDINAITKTIKESGYKPFNNQQWKAFFSFGEKIDAYDYKVINERDARASAGIMFLLGILSLFSVHLYRTIFWAELFSITFIIEFVFRTMVNPKYAPYMLIGGLIVSNQQPDWVEAKPKRFAWALGMALGVIMTYYIIFDIITPIRLAICWLCLFLMFVESVFGICLGCLLYKKLKWKTYNCPGGICDAPSPPYNKKKLLIITAFLVLFFITYAGLKAYKFNEKPKIIIIKE